MEERLGEMTEPVYRMHRVWDPLLRALHWWNALTVLALVTLGTAIMFLGEDLPHAMEEGLITLHVLFGYLFAAGLLVRILWLFIGPQSAGWKDLLPITAGRRRTVLDTLKFYAGFLRGTPPLYKAHNPFAGMVYAVFFIIAAVQVGAGVVLVNLPDDLRDKSVSLELHEAGYILIMLYIAAHVFAVVVHELTERHGLISAMVNGDKGFTEEEWERLKDE
ncbi:MAG: cytochrome b/b6 domain-containing protein [Deltaproteobacteria bacterium]|nr:cytochrome b/b6 domain-containing protein [Deltaproteobacteria bacterium]